jgi:hypothetical protein
MRLKMSGKALRVLEVLTGFAFVLLVMVGVYNGFAFVYGLVHNNWRVVGLSAFAFIPLAYLFTIFYSAFVDFLRAGKKKSQSPTEECLRG